MKLFFIIIMSLAFTCSGVNNLLPNASMELWHESGLRPQAWGAWTKPGTFHTFRVSKDNRHKKHGSFSMRIEADDFVNIFSGSKLKAGEKYSLSAWVRPEQKSTITVKFSLKYKAKGIETPASLRRDYKLEAGKWQRVSVSGKIPTGVKSATLYFCFKRGKYNFDSAMLNKGKLLPFKDGWNYKTIAPLGYPPQAHQATMRVKSYGKNNLDLKDIEIGFLFDRDQMSYGRLTKPDVFLPKCIGAEFSEAVYVRGIYFLGQKTGIPEDTKVSVSVLKSGKWQDIKARYIAVGCSNLFMFDPEKISGIRLNFLAKDNKKIKCPKIYTIGIAQ